MTASFNNVLFRFDNGTENDLSEYEYELYEEDDIVNPNTEPYAIKPGLEPGTFVPPFKSGKGNSSVFAIPVEGSYIDEENDNIVVQKNFFGRVRAIDTSGNESSWTSIVKTDLSTPLIDSQYVVSLTADKIKAGEIEAAEIILGGANPANTIIKSKTYDTTSGAQGWYIGGDGYFSLGGPNGITYNNSVITIGTAVNVQSELNAQSLTIGNGSYGILTIDEGIGPSNTDFGIQLGDPSFNYWYANGKFSVGNSNRYIRWNGASLEIKGTLSGADGTFSGALSGGTISIGSGNNIFKADSNGIYLGNATFASAPFRVSASGALTATSVNISGTITGSSISGSSLSTSDGTNGILITSDGYIRGTGGQGVRIQSSDGTAGATKFFNNSIFTGELGCNSISVSPNGLNEVNIDPSGTGFDVDITTGGIRVANGHTIRASTSFRTTGSSTTARLSQGDSPGDDLMGRPSSLRALKENIEDIDNALQKLSSLRPRKYNFKVNAFSEIDPTTGQPWTQEAKEFATLDHKYGFIVEEVFESNPDLISYTFEIENNSTPNYLDFSKWKPTMWEDVDVLTLCVKAIQELSEKVDELESRLI